MARGTGRRTLRVHLGALVRGAEPLTLLGLVGALGLLLVALFGGRIAPHEPIHFVVEHGSAPRPYDPGVVFPFGSDVLGRDLFSLVLAGAGTTLSIVVVAGVARVVSGVLLAALGSWWRPVRASIEIAVGLTSAIPATLAALLIIKAFAGAAVDLGIFIAALLVFGWAGPYRVICAEVDRLARAPFTEGARSLGVREWRVFWRHQLPHLAPVVVMNLSQQIVAALILVAELGVLGVAVGVTRTVSIEESVSLVLPGQVNIAQLSDPPEWGALLAGSRTVEALWVTRWLILLPGVAFAITATAVALLGFALARRYARRDVVSEVMGRGAGALALLVLAVFVAASLVPERYAAARDWATAARDVRPTTAVDIAFGDAGLATVAEAYAVRREAARIVQSAAASVRVGSVGLTEPWPRVLRDMPDQARTLRSFVTRSTGGGTVEAPLVFAGRGISPADYEPRPAQLGVRPQPDFAQLIRDYAYADDYAGIDVRGKVVLLVRFLGIQGPTSDPALRDYAMGPLVEQSISAAIRRGAAAVIFVDPALWLYHDVDTGVFYGRGELRGGSNPYLRAERLVPPAGVTGVPVVVLGEQAARELAAPLGIDLDPFLHFDARTDSGVRTSASKELGVTARVAVPLDRQTAAATSYLGEVAGAPEDAGRILLWAIRRTDANHPPTAVLAALARSLAATRAPVVLVDFDPSVDAAANATEVRRALGDRRIALVIVLDKLEGSALRITTPHGELIQAFDFYAERAGARHETTRETAGLADMSGLAPFADVKTVLLRGNGEGGDLRPDAAALVGYVAGRLALGAKELPR